MIAGHFQRETQSKNIVLVATLCGHHTRPAAAAQRGTHR